MRTSSKPRLRYAVLSILGISVSAAGAEYSIEERFTLLIHEMGSTPYLSPLVDMDGDGVLDFFAGNSLYLGKGDGDFDRRVIFEDPTAVTGIGDVDSDGAEDILGVSPYYTAPGLGLDPAHARKMVILRNVWDAGAGFSFPRIQEFPIEYEKDQDVPVVRFSEHLADLDLDGDLDLVGRGASFRLFPFGETRNYPHVSVALGDGSGRFGAITFYLALPVDDDLRPVVDSLGSWPILADLDRDAFPDVVWPMTSEDAVAVLSVILNDGKGGFGDPHVYPTLTAHQPHVLTTAAFDFDGDGDQDLINGHSDKPFISFLFNEGEGSFFLGKEVSTFESGLPGNPSRVFPADLDLNGRVDVLTFDGGVIDIVFDVLGEPVQAVRSPREVTGTFRTMMRAGDLDSDGLEDVILNGGWCERQNGPCLISILLGELSWPFVRGDLDMSGAQDVSDAVSVLGYLFQGSPEPICLDRADTDDNGRVEISDAIFLLGSLFLGLGELPPPSRASGFDSTIDSLFCGG